MKRLRVTALGLMVAVSLVAAAPAAFAEDTWVPGRLALGGPGGWLAEWVAWLVDLVAPAPGGPRAVTAQDGGCIGPDGAPRPCATGEAAGPGGEGDTGGCIGPDGAPCRP
jgi:hypothetical protein